MPKAMVAASKVRVLGRQGERVPDHVLEPGPAGVLALRDVDHPGRDVDAQDPAAGLRARVEVGGDLAGARRDVERAPPGRSPVARTRRRRQNGSWNAEIARFIGS